MFPHLATFNILDTHSCNYELFVVTCITIILPPMKTEFNKIGWQPLSYGNPSRLTDTILQMYHAVQFIAMADRYLMPESRSKKGVPITWDTSGNSYRGRLIPAEEPFRLCMQANKFDLVIMTEKDRERARLHLAGDTKGYIFSWLKENISGCCDDWGKLKPVSPWPLPGHPVDKGKPFRIADPEAVKEVSRYRSNAQKLFAFIAAEYESVSEIAVSPVNFNTECLLSLGFDRSGVITEPVILGLSLYDAFVGEPYFFISYSETGEKDRDRRLEASRILAASGPEGQLDTVIRFLRESL